MTNRCKNITLPQTSFAGGKYLMCIDVVLFAFVTAQNVGTERYLRINWTNVTWCVDRVGRQNNKRTTANTKLEGYKAVWLLHAEKEN